MDTGSDMEQQLYVSRGASRRHHQDHQHHRCGSVDASRAELREENLWLVQQLAISEVFARHSQDRIRHLRHQLRTRETQYIDQREQWQKALDDKERKWMGEYDRHMQSLLLIIAHHEETQQTLQEQLKAMRKERDDARRDRQKVVRVVEMATQTESAEVHVHHCDHEPLALTETVAVQSQLRHHDDDCEPARTGQAVPPQANALPVPSTVSPSIHEQYVALTMQKLFQQLRESNSVNVPEDPQLLPSAKTNTPAAAASLPSYAFRDSIRRRLSSPYKPVPLDSCLQRYKTELDTDTNRQWPTEADGPLNPFSGVTSSHKLTPIQETTVPIQRPRPFPSAA